MRNTIRDSTGIAARSMPRSGATSSAPISMSPRRLRLDMRGLVGPALASAAVMLVLAPAAALFSQNWAWCANQRRPLSSSAANRSLEISSNLMRAQG